MDVHAVSVTIIAVEEPSFACGNPVVLERLFFPNLLVNSRRSKRKVAPYRQAAGSYSGKETGRDRRNLGGRLINHFQPFARAVQEQRV